MKIMLIGLVAALAATASAALAQPIDETELKALPGPPREFRAAWIASVSNIDWPSKPGLPVEQQKRELLAMLDRAKELNLNAVVLQIRPAADALYDSPLEPWSEYLTGEMGKAPEPYYDPLTFAVDEAHKRGLQLHAWFNPYRARHPSAKSQIHPTHISRAQPGMAPEYGTHLWMDPGEKAVQDHSAAVFLDVVKRYDVDGIHIDDYFYPYKVNGPDGKPLDFPDGPSWKKYRDSGGTLSRDDWRRENVNVFIKRVYEEIKAERPTAMFGISPFGIYRPGIPEGIAGFDQYSQLYADARKWLVEGWLDYWTPQLYWPIEQKAQAYPVLLQYWVSQNVKGRHIWPGNYTSKVIEGGNSGWDASEILNQILATRKQNGADGNVHFSMKALMRDGDLGTGLKNDVYARQALVPASPWLDNSPPAKPEAGLHKDDLTGALTAHWESGDGEAPFLWVLYTRTGNSWEYRILPAETTQFELTGIDVARTPNAIGISAVDRMGNESERVLVLNSRPSLNFSRLEGELGTSGEAMPGGSE